MQALWIWRQFPKQIASDLSQYHHRRIAEWHSGMMSSYELLELLEFMPERGAFKTALRQDEYSEEEQVWRHVANKLSRIESILYVANTRKAADPQRMFYTMAEMREQIEEAEAAEERREDFFGFADRTPMKELDHDLDWAEVD